VIIGAAVGSIIAAIITAHIKDNPMNCIGENTRIIIADMPGIVDMSLIMTLK
jgi:hypothetical protein